MTRILLRVIFNRVDAYRLLENGALYQNQAAKSLQ